MKVIELGQSAKVISGYAFKSTIFQDDGIPVIKISNIGFGDVRFNSTNTQFVDKEWQGKLDKKYHVTNGDILISLTGSHITQPSSVVGRVALYNKSFNSLLNQRAGKVININKEILNPKYLFYLLNSSSVRTNMALMASGAASQANISPKDVESLKLLVPTLENQKKIAAILSTYDDLINVNKKRIKLLEDTVTELYKEWFVRFRFPNWENEKFIKGAPKGWEFRKLTEISDITYGYAFDSSRFSNEYVGKKIVRIRNILESKSLDFTDEVVDDRYIIRNGDLLIGMDGVFHMNRWYDGESYLVQRTCRINAKNKVFQAYLRLAMKAPISFYQATILGATVGHLGAKHLNEVVIILPSEEYLPLIGRLNNIDELILEIELTNRNLEAQRDNLLPRLISGELSVAELDIHYPPSMQANYEATDN